MDTLVLGGRHDSSYLVSRARLVSAEEEGLEDLAKDLTADWQIARSNPFVQWIAGDFVESDRPNSNTQFWTAGDLALSEYSILHAPLNMVHKFRTPIGFFAETRRVALEKSEQREQAHGSQDQGPLKIQALSGLWSHVFPFESAQAQAAHDEGLLFYSMECRGTHLTCAGPNGCGKTFEYSKTSTHCEHLMERSSIRHIVKPTFRGGALIVPPVKPGWKQAKAHVLSDSVMAEAAAFAEQNEQQYRSLVGEGVDMTPSSWEHLMAMVVSQHARA